ncbi:hypothetical protein EUA06_00925 [Nocardioides glacieisoli]|uniref:NERD domain-containing protein n=1 Tax=Nocardioides glacieisoli TaxID=1168730 RepID=A0A4Q2S376_9ACTN|nr:nuclease-related domain-containing protein [Nocardioides glacieisoli]RYB96180.1 hypothetical protein EUA06_00925 [Nocardioides glacieisoli]
MSTVKSYPSRELRRLRTRWLMQNKNAVSVACAFFLASALIATWLGVAYSTRATWYLVGVLHAGLVATVLHFLNSAVLAHEPRAVFQLRGAWGEDNTRSELQRAKKRKLIWDWVDSIPLQASDLDHVVVTRSGGVVVLDSKFRTDLTSAGVAEMTVSAARARVRTEALARTVLPRERSGRRRATGTSVAVTPCIVLWGPARRGMPEEHVVDGVHFVDGNKLVQWLEKLPTSTVSQEAGSDLLIRLRKFRDLQSTRS